MNSIIQYIAIVFDKLDWVKLFLLLFAWLFILLTFLLWLVFIIIFGISIGCFYIEQTELFHLRVKTHDIIELCVYWPYCSKNLSTGLVKAEVD